MKASLLPIPGIVLGAYPERRGSGTGMRSRSRPSATGRATGARYRAFLARVETTESKLGALGPQAIAMHLGAMRARMARHGMTDELVAIAFVLVKQACVRALGLNLFPTQLLAARVMLDSKLAEMATGEGKTLAAGLCAATAALAGIPVHVVTANEYLVTRDSKLLEPLFDALGLSVAAVIQSLDPEARRRAYDCDIVYCTASELVFDYLRDGLTRDRSRSDLQQRVAGFRDGRPLARPTLLRGLCMAIVDEADSILIDEARVPMILSERRSNEREKHDLAAALELGGALEAGTHYVLKPRNMSVDLTDAGRARIDELTAGGAWQHRLHREEMMRTALAALHLYERDRHYLVRDDRVAIIDESTGRVAHGRVWSRGLHRLIELKEQCAAGDDTVPVAQITFQRFFQRYLVLAGMSGTLTEARTELYSTYGLSIVKVPLRHGERRTVLPTRLYPDRESQWQAVVAQAMEMKGRGRPVLIGTDSVADSEALARRFTEAGVPHAVLNARQDFVEAQVIAQAGQAGQITIATNMAGRGTDIALGAKVSALGGLHVICCQHSASRRIERQLVGRCARLGDPGSAGTLLALDKPLIAPFAPLWLRRRVSAQGTASPRWLVRMLVRVPQHLEERRQRAQRRDLLKQDARAAINMSFGKPIE